MTKREKQRWTRRVGRYLMREVLGAVDIEASCPNHFDEEVMRFGRSLIRKFRKALRNVR